MGYIIKPIVTEKMSKLTDKSSLDKTARRRARSTLFRQQPKYGFIVKPEARQGRHQERGRGSVRR